MEMKALDYPSYWLSSCNVALEAVLMRAGKPAYQSFGSLMHAMRSSEWGYSDFVVEFLLEVQGEVYIFSHSGSVAHTRPKTVMDVRRTYFMINESDDEGDLLHDCSC